MSTPVTSAGSCRNGAIPYVKWGHLIRFDPAYVAEWLKQMRRPGGDPT